MTTSRNLDPTLVVIKRGKLLITTLTRFLKDHHIDSAYLSGIGTLTNVELGYYDLATKTYLHKLFQTENFELLSLSGNVALKENQPFIHAHVALSQRNFSTFGGHLFEATVAATAEITIIPLKNKLHRKMDDETGLALICPL